MPWHRCTSGTRRVCRGLCQCVTEGAGVQGTSIACQVSTAACRLRLTKRTLQFDHIAAVLQSSKSTCVLQGACWTTHWFHGETSFDGGRRTVCSQTGPWARHHNGGLNPTGHFRWCITRMYMNIQWQRAVTGCTQRAPSTTGVCCSVQRRRAPEDTIMQLLSYAVLINMCSS